MFVGVFRCVDAVVVGAEVAAAVELDVLDEAMPEWEAA